MEKGEKSIITITGPRSVGKTTVSKILAKKLKKKYISADEMGEKVFKKYGGLNEAIKSGIVRETINEGGYSIILGTYKEKNFVFDLSGGAFGSKSMAKASKKIRETAKKHSIIFGLLPSKNTEESIKLLFEREKERVHFKEMDATELLEKTKKSYEKFPKLFSENCDFVIYTKDKTPNKIVSEILEKLK